MPIGDVIVIAEADYLYGAGRIVLRVEHIDRSHPVDYDDDVWYPVRGVQISMDGTDRGEREVLVRGRRLTDPMP